MIKVGDKVNGFEIVSEVEFEGVKYFVADAYLENYGDGTGVFAQAYTGELDEYGDYKRFEVRWDYIEADEMENVADWETPVEVSEI